MAKSHSIRFLSILCAIVLLGCAGCADRSVNDLDNTAPALPTAEETTIPATTIPEETVPETTVAEETVPETTVPETTEALYIPEIYPDAVGLYIPQEGSKNRVLVTEFSGSRTPKTDIDCFEVFASDAGLIEGSSFKSMWNQVWNSHEGGENAKIGFHIDLFLDNGEVISKTLLKPSDCDEFFEYLEVYMYDDIHQTGWYSHLEDKDMGDGTIISSVKLHCGERISEVGDIILTAFIYNGDDCFDSNGNYIGQVSASVYIYG